MVKAGLELTDIGMHKGIPFPSYIGKTKKFGKAGIECPKSRYNISWERGEEVEIP
jgi:hypothetical protein